MLTTELGDKQSLLDAIGKDFPEQPQQQRSKNSTNEALQGSIVFIKTHKTATEYVTIAFVITASC